MSKHVRALLGLARTSARLIPRAESHRENSLFLSGQIGCKALAAIDRIESLADVEMKVFSQWGEDGIIEWLVSRLPGIPETFVEFGVEDYAEANTRFLLMNRNWRGLILDGSERHMERVKQSALYWKHELHAVAAFVTAENIDGLIASQGLRGEIGILSVDIDGNDYWVWKAIEGVSPWLVIVEYNAVFGDRLPITVPYRAEFMRSRAHPSFLSYGASIKAFEELARRKGYTLIGSNRAGSNAFSLRDDKLAALDGRIASRTARPSRVRESRDASGNLSFLSGRDRVEAIAATPVVDVTTGERHLLSDLRDRLYSSGWTA